MTNEEAAHKFVEAMIGAGASFERIEQYIEERADLSNDVRSALWLLAWCETDPEQRRSVIRELTASVVGSRNAQTA